MTPPFYAIFDVDGTIADTMELHFHAFMRLAEEEGFVFDRTTFQKIFGWHNDDIFRLFFGPDITKARSEELAFRKETAVRDAAQTGLLPTPGLHAFLDELDAMQVPMGVGSSAPADNVRVFLELLGVHDRFRAFARAEDVTRGKPDPQVFLVAAERLGASPEQCVVFEDAPAGVAAGLAAGMKVVALMTNRSAEELAGAHKIVSSFAALSGDDVAALFA